MDIAKTEDCLLLDLTEDGEEGRLHAVTVEGVFSGLDGLRNVKISSKTVLMRAGNMFQ